MMPERWPQVDELLGQALQRRPAGRARCRAEACAGGTELRLKVESLPAAHEPAAAFIDAPALGVAARAQAAEAESLIGRELGHYQVVALLGAGGMGEVYKARDTRLDRPVAVKIL